MAKLLQQLREILAGGHNVWVATTGADGMPNVSIKGSGALLDDEHLYFADMSSEKTLDNLRRDPRVAVGIDDPERLRMRAASACACVRTSRTDASQAR